MNIGCRIVRKKVIRKKNDKVCINIVPGFPVLTTDTQLNYGKKIELKNGTNNEYNSKIYLTIGFMWKKSNHWQCSLDIPAFCIDVVEQAIEY